MVDGRVFSVGDFVWGKIRNHPWWPGQIYHASDASELALKHKPKDKSSYYYLVAYFGDGTFSWCSAAQLKLFCKHFESMSCQTSSKSFMFAVEDALSVMCDCEAVALEMKCSCVQVGYAARPVAENTGITKGVYVPMVRVDRLADARFDAAAGIVDAVKNAAWSVSVKNKLVLTMLISELLAFYRSKGYSALPKYYFPVYIDGLEDMSERADELKLYDRREQTGLGEIIKEEPDTDVHHEEKSVSGEGRRRKSVGEIYSSKKERSKGRRTMVAITRGEKDGAIKQVRFEPMIINLHRDDGEGGERMSKAAKLITESPPIRKRCNIIFEKEPTQECITDDDEWLLLGDETMKLGRVSNGIDLMPKEMVSGIRLATFTPERPFGSRLDVFSLNKVSNYDTLMKLDNDDDDDGRRSSQLSNNDKNSHHLSIRYLKQKVETMISKLSNMEGDTLSSDLKSELHREMTNLLHKLS